MNIKWEENQGLGLIAKPADGFIKVMVYKVSGAGYGWEVPGDFIKSPDFGDYCQTLEEAKKLSLTHVAALLSKAEADAAQLVAQDLGQG